MTHRVDITRTNDQAAIYGSHPQKEMSVAEFRALGYLQEVNRRFLNPLGLALTVNIEHDGTETFGGIIDARDDEGGIIFGDVDKSRAGEVAVKAALVQKEIDGRLAGRLRAVGAWVQPVPTSGSAVHLTHASSDRPQTADLVTSPS